MRNLDTDNSPFRPGDLVHTTSINKFPEVYRQGLKTGRAVLGEDGSSTPDDICFAMISKVSAEERFLKAGHLGPKNRDSESVALLISREKVLKYENTGKLVAVGTRFWREKQRASAREFYDFDDDSGKVYGIEIVPDEDTQYTDQVRFWSSFPFDTRITPDYWDGIVVQEQKYGELMDQMNKEGLSLDLPVYTPYGQVLKGTSGELSTRKQLVFSL